MCSTTASYYERTNIRPSTTSGGLLDLIDQIDEYTPETGSADRGCAETGLQDAGFAGGCAETGLQDAGFAGGCAETGLEDAGFADTMHDDSDLSTSATGVIRALADLADRMDIHIHQEAGLWWTIADS